MYVPIWTPFAWTWFVGAVETDKATGGALSNAIDRALAGEMDRQFNFSGRPNRLHPERYGPGKHAEYLRNA